MPTPCRHCHVRTGDPRRAGLCYHCRAIPGLRQSYPRREQPQPTETMADVERLIAERLASAPAWFWREYEVQREREEREPQVGRRDRVTRVVWKSDRKTGRGE